MQTKGLSTYSLGNKVKQLLGGAYENGDQMFAMNPKGPWKSWERASTTKDVKDQNIPKHTRSKIKFIMNALQPTTSFPYCFLRKCVTFIL
jgi:hypothetical protein